MNAPLKLVRKKNYQRFKLVQIGSNLFKLLHNYHEWPCTTFGVKCEFIIAQQMQTNGLAQHLVNTLNLALKTFILGGGMATTYDNDNDI